ncbi:MAG: hypothetical protein HRU75_08145 [Planctomycetia bacterium]|nr:MAG: hypothetical protein HRU75_08145 [Planctomycetia bacterium]
MIRVLSDANGPMHYSDIADAIAERELRQELGATPANSVNGCIFVSMQREGDRSPFVRLSRGMYALRQGNGLVTDSRSVDESEADETGLINAFGMYWARSSVLWSAHPRVLGHQHPGSSPVDFCEQKGVYLLHDGHAVVYVGRTTDQPLGVRLRQHTIDRLNGRWNRFSWFGVCGVSESGALETPRNERFDLSMLIVTMEALLIEGLEPPQNRRRGDEFKAVEFLQAEDPDIQRQMQMRAIDELKRRL